MARAVGANLKLLFKEESAYGTNPGGTDFLQIPCFTFELGAQQALNTDFMLSAGLARDSGDPYLDTLTVEGNTRVPLDLVNTGHWLNLLMNAPTTTGSTDYTHVFKSGGTSLPSWTMEKGFPDVPSFGLLTGVMANTFEMTVDPTGPAEWTLGLLGRDETNSGTSVDASPTLATITRFQKPTATISREGTPLGNITAGTIRYSNGLEAVRTIRSDNKLEGVDLSIGTGGGSITSRFASTTLIDDAIANADLEIAYKLTISATKSIEFIYHRCFLSRPRIGIQGPGGIELQSEFQAAYDATAGCMLTVTLKNQTATY